ncbi:hypothetical protein EMIT07CA2_10224 [Brevibacillus sp. IT-7CA2]
MLRITDFWVFVFSYRYTLVEQVAIGIVLNIYHQETRLRRVLLPS